VLSHCSLWLFFSKAYVKVQTFYQPLFSRTFPFRNFPLAILFPSVILFPSKSFPPQKAQSKRIKPKPKPKPPKIQAQNAQGKKQKASDKKQKPPALLQWAFIYKQWQIGGAEALKGA
jgi:hypothetical protein